MDPNWLYWVKIGVAAGYVLGAILMFIGFWFCFTDSE